MKFVNALFLTICLSLASISSQAAVTLPMLDVQTLGGDAGIIWDNSSLYLDASAIAIITNTDPIDIVDTEAVLAASYVSTAGIQSTFDDGTLEIGTLLNATFDNLTIINFGNGSGQFFADLTYTNGDLVQGLGSGRIEGALSNIELIADTWSADVVIAKVGEITPVPLPAGLVLMLSGFVGLLPFRKRS